MVTTATVTGIMQKLYGESTRPCGNDIRRRLHAWDDLEEPWARWSQREKRIRNHTYSRGRDIRRAFRQNDFRLAGELDKAAA